jgi:enoyl-CoA hydratase
MSVVTGERRGAVLLPTLNRPERLNAINRAVLAAFDEWCRRAADDPDIRVIVLTGAGDRAFCAGADVMELRDLSEDTAYEFMRYGQGVFARIEQLPKPVLAAINGHALGGGCELAMACDQRYAAEGARLGQPEIRLANLPGWGGTQRLPRLVGPARAKELIFTGEPIDAATASAIGLVNRVFPGTELLPAVLTLASQLAGGASLPIALAKRAMAIGLRDGQDVGERAEARAVAPCCSTPEQRSAVAAFLARRR